MERKIVKAEILFSRQCPLSCSYCAMKNKVANDRTIEEWINGIIQLKKLGCEFIAFYGAEPLTEFEKLQYVVEYAEKVAKIDTTIITSGAVSNFKEKLDRLHECGARSLSMSFDPAPSDFSAIVKSKNAMKWLLYFKELYNIRDVAAIATLNAQNFKAFPDMIKTMSSQGIWSFFDFIHEDRGQPGTKCGKVADDLKLKPKHYADIKAMLNEVMQLKKEKYLCHTSKWFTEVIKNNMAYDNLYAWTCSYRTPSWVTIDCNGYVIPCDDFCGNANIDMTEIYDKWYDFCQRTTSSVKHHNCKCAWNTHIDAHGIMDGVVNIGDYIHGN